MTTTQQLRIGSSSRVLRVDVDQLPRAKQVRRLFSILSRRPPITKSVSMYQRASCAKHSRPSASLELPAQSMRTRRACRLQAARRACLLPRSSTNSSKNNLTVWAAVGGRRRGIYSLYRALQPTPPDSGESKCVANHVDVQRCSRGVFHRMPPLLRLGLDRAHADLNLGALSHFCIVQSAFPCPLQILGQNELRCEPRECSIVLTMCISPHPTSSPTRIRPKLSLFEHRALQRQSAPQIGLRVRAKRGALRNTRLFYSSA